MLSPKIFHLCQNRLGLTETYQEFNREPLLCVLCDALHLSKPEENASISKDFEKIIKKHLLIQRHNFTEKSLKKTLDHAQKHLNTKYAQEAHLLKVSVLILIEAPNSEEEDEKKFYICGVGDFKVLEINNPSSVLFYDSETPSLPLELSLKKRFHYLTNVIGQSTMKASTHKFSSKQIPDFLILSYGSYSSIGEDKWEQIVSEFETKKNNLIRLVSKSNEKEHSNLLVYISLQDHEIKNKKSAIETKLNKPPSTSYFNFKKAFYSLKWTLKVLVVLILGICIFELTQKTSMLSSFNNSTYDSVKSSVREPQKSLNLTSFNSPSKFSFIKERAYIVDLKEKYDRQTLTIEKLNMRIRDQEKLLRDQQIKTYLPIPVVEIPKQKQLGERSTSY
ncbi:MAG: hypothetical protein S4CHLAM7_04150 [Chlamydiae bacterium]|nr:hypothetical protein [Chlamydiota bacterium]